MIAQLLLSIMGSMAVLWRGHGIEMLWTLLAIACAQIYQCAALSPSNQSVPNAHKHHVISQRSDGKCELFSFDSEKQPLADVEVQAVRDKMQRRFPSLAVSALHRIRSSFQSTFLPTVAGDYDVNALRSTGYLKYILYDNIQDLSTSLRSVLAKHRVLEGIGVGRPGATASSATLTFILRDGFGILSSLVFTSYAARLFRLNAKQWKFFSAVMLDLGLALQIVASSVRGWFLPLLCLGSIVEALHNVCSSPCAGVIRLHWAHELLGSEDGIAEIAAKRRAQKTMMELVGLVVANLLVRWLDSSRSKELLICLYGGLTFIHILSNKYGLNLVALDWLNGWRLRQVTNEFLERVFEDADGLLATRKRNVGVSSPLQLSKAEPLLFEIGTAVDRDIRMGVSFNDLASVSLEDDETLRSELKNKSPSADGYLLSVGVKRDRLLVNAAFFRTITNKCTAKAFLHSCILVRVLRESQQRSKGAHQDEIGAEFVAMAKDAAKRKLELLWPLFETSLLEAGWRIDKTTYPSEGYQLVIRL